MAKGYSGASSTNALEYPWDPPKTSGLIAGSDFFPLQLVEGRRLGQSHQRHGFDESLTSHCLNKVLVEANAAPLDSRYLMVSIGSNSSPDVMRRKLAQYGKPVSRVLPLVRAQLHNVGIGHSAHVSRAGYIAAAPYFRYGACSTVWVSWLDERQLLALEETEPNYRRIQLDAGTCPLVIDNGERPEKFYLFTSRWGVLTDGNGQRLPFMDQRTLFGLLADAGGPREVPRDGRHLFEGSAHDIAVRLATPSNQAWIKEWFRAAGLAGQSDLENSDSAGLAPYGDVPSIERPAQKESFRALPTNDLVEHQGQQCIAIRPDEAEELGIQENALVKACLQGNMLSNRPGLMVRVVRMETLSKGTVLVDQIVRNALGIERQEYVSLQPATAARSSRVLSLLGDPSYIVCRVQAADLASVEQEVALVEPLALRFLGILQGDAVILEGIQLNDAGVLQPVRLRAIELPDSVRERRTSLSGGGLEARFPSSADALGVFPDLPSIFLDASIRRRLGLGSSKLTAIRIRASRRHQLFTQLREVLLVLVLALIGVVSIVPDRLGVFAAILVIFSIAVVVVIFRLRGQLGLRRKPSRLLRALRRRR